MRRINLGLRISYILLCFVLFVAHLYIRTVKYLMYQTDTKFALYTPISQNLVKLSFCFNLDTLTSKKFHKSFFDQTGPTFINKTAKFIFKATPKAEQFLRRCEYRDFNLDLLWRKSGLECSKILNIERYRMGMYMCYKLDLNGTQEFDFYRLTHSFFDSSKLSRLELNVPFEKGHALLAIAHFGEYPYTERIYNQEIVQSITDRQMLDLYYDVFEFYRLPRPYERPCNNRDIHECFFECERVNSGQFNYSGHGGFTYLGQFNEKTQIVSLEKANRSLFFEIDLKCFKLCAGSRLCEQKLAFTFASNRFKNQLSIFNFDTARYPITKICYQAKFSMESYLTECFSQAAVWFGFSFFVLLIKLNRCQGQKSDLVTQFKRSVHILLELKKYLTFGLTVKPRGHFADKGDRSKQRKLIYRRFKIISCLFITFTTSMLLVQLSNVSIKYFTYETQLKIDYETNPKLVVPSLAICINLADHFNVNVDPFDHEIDEVMNRFDSLELQLDKLFNKLNASGDHILFKCRVRDFNQTYWNIKLLNASECSEQFNILPFYSDLQMCHSIVPKKTTLNEWFRVSHIKLAPLNPGIIYSIIPHSRLKNFVSLELILFLGDYPYLSKEFGMGSYRTLKPRLEVLSYQTTQYILLPPPYDTKCVAEEVPISNCYMQAVKQINRVPYGGLHISPMPKRLLTYSDLKNESINRYWINLEKKCSGINTIQKCSGSYTQTYNGYPLETREFDLELAVQTTRYPVLLRRSIERVTFYEFYFQILCCLNFWLGFTFIAVNPVDFFFKSNSAKLKSFIHKQIPRINSRIRRFHRLFLNSPNVKKGSLLEGIKVGPLVKKVILVFFCFTGCCISLKEKVAEYLTYPILIENERRFEHNTNYSMTICPDTIYTLPRSQVDLEVYYLNASRFMNVSVDEIFKRSPQPSDLIIYCRLYGSKDDREFNDLSKASDRVLVTFKHKKDCLDQLVMKKFVMQSKVCYTYQPKKKLKWNRHQMINTFNGPKYLFMLAFKANLLTRRYNLIINEGDGIPEMSFMWATKIINLRENVWHVASYVKFYQEVLRPPYSDDGFKHALHMSCIGKCVNGHFTSTNLSISSMFDKANNFRFITFEDRTNSFVNRIVNSAFNSCSQSCSRNHESPKNIFAFASTFVTSGKIAVNATWVEHSSNVSRIYVRSTDFPVLIQIFKEKYSFFELVITIGSIIGIWSGISVIDLNPFKRRVKFSSEVQLSELQLFLAKLKLKTNLRLRIILRHKVTQHRPGQASRFRAKTKNQVSSGS